MKIVLVDRSAADRKYYRILLSQSLLAHAAAAAGAGAGGGARGFATPSATTGPLPSSESQYEFFEASLGIQALELSREVRPDCILLDYQLPDMDGLEFLRALKAEGGEPCAVVMLTGLASEQVARGSLQAGAQDYLVKDRVNAETLRLAVEKATQRVRLVRELQMERDRLEQAVTDRDVLLGEARHRLKNQLQIVASLLQMQTGVLDEGHAAGDVLRDCLHRVEAIGLVQNQLDAQDGAPIHMDSQALEIQAARLLQNLCVAFGSEAGRIERRVSVVGPLTLGSAQAVPLALVLNELISNALKHAFPGGRKGFIEVAARCQQGNVEVSVRDNGVGIIPQGLDTPERGNLGLKIVQVLARQLKGTVRMEHEGGTAFHIVFPEAAAKTVARTNLQAATPARKLPGSSRGGAPVFNVVSYNGPSAATSNPYARPAPRFRQAGK